MPDTMFPEVKDGQITGEVYKHIKKKVWVTLNTMEHLQRIR